MYSFAISVLSCWKALDDQCLIVALIVTTCFHAQTSIVRQGTYHNLQGSPSKAAFRNQPPSRAQNFANIDSAAWIFQLTSEKNSREGYYICKFTGNASSATVTVIDWWWTRKLNQHKKSSSSERTLKKKPTIFRNGSQRDCRHLVHDQPVPQPMQYLRAQCPKNCTVSKQSLHFRLNARKNVGLDSSFFLGQTWLIVFSSKKS